MLHFFSLSKVITIIILIRKILPQSFSICIITFSYRNGKFSFHNWLGYNWSLSVKQKYLTVTFSKYHYFYFLVMQNITIMCLLCCLSQLSSAFSVAQSLRTIHVIPHRRQKLELYSLSSLVRKKGTSVKISISSVNLSVTLFFII